MFYKIADLLHAVTVGACLFLFSVFLVSTAAAVLLRYGLSYGAPWLQDVSVFSFGGLIVLAIPCAFRAGRHMRADIFRDVLEKRPRRLLDLLSILLLLLPLAGTAIWFSIPALSYAWLVGETSAQAGGLPYLYLIRSLMPLAFGLSVIQALASLNASLER